MTVCSLKIIRECMRKSKGLAAARVYERALFERIQSEKRKLRGSYRPSHETPAADGWSLDC